MLSKVELAIGSTIYSYTFFKEINGNNSFHVPEDCQNDLYWPLKPELFLYWSVSMFTLHSLSSQLRLVVANPHLTHFSQKNKTCFSVHITHSSIISHSLHFSVIKNLMTDLCSSLKHSVLFVTILNSLKRNIIVRWKFLIYTNSK